MSKKNIIVFLILMMGLQPLPGTAAFAFFAEGNMEASASCSHAMMDDDNENHTSQSEGDCVFLAQCSLHSCGSCGLAASVFLPEADSPRRFLPIANTASRNLLPPPEIRPPIFIL